MFESPIYPFNQPLRTDPDGTKVYREIVIDVTRSAPSFDSPGKTLGKTLRKVLSDVELAKVGEILDFGAGKLRNTLYLLERGHRVCAVEYERLFQESDQAIEAERRARRYRSRFSELVYPHQFDRSRRKFSLVLLINVLNIMPVPAERLVVLQACYSKLRKNGYLFWYTQRGDADYAARLTPAYRLGDGYYVGRRSKLKTFYREFTVAEIDDQLASSGFEFVHAISATPRNQARLYRKRSTAPLIKVLNATAIRNAAVVDEAIPQPVAVKPRIVSARGGKRKGNPDPEALKLPSLYKKSLLAISVGSSSARRYQEHVKIMLELLFRGELTNLELETDVFGGIKRLDILATNKGRSGFFHSLKADHQLLCPTIVIECKNYRHEVANPEFDQLGSRLGRKLGRVGVLAFRNSRKWEAVIRRCQSFFDNDEKLIIPLDDDDFVELLRLKSESDERGIEGFLDRRVLKVKTG
jgi:SAM-dependent methyltransferase